MNAWAITFLVIGLIAGVAGFSGITGSAATFAWIGAAISLVLAVVFAIAGRRPPE